MKITADMIKEDADIFFIEGYITSANAHGSTISPDDANILIDRIYKQAINKIHELCTVFNDHDYIVKWHNKILESQKIIHKMLMDMVVV